MQTIAKADSVIRVTPMWGGGANDRQANPKQVAKQKLRDLGCSYGEGMQMIAKQKLRDFNAKSYPNDCSHERGGWGCNAPAQRGIARDERECHTSPKVVAETPEQRFALPSKEPPTTAPQGGSNR